jgi:DNA-binding transcriptional LysR family regulator
LLTSLAEEMVAHVDERKPNVVCVSTPPPAAVMHARHLCKHLRGRFPKVQLIVGLWDSQADLAKARERIGCDAIVVVTLAEAQEQVRLLTQSHLQPAESHGPLDVGTEAMEKSQQ